MDKHQFTKADCSKGGISLRFELQGRTFGFLEVLKRGEPFPRGGARWWCRCLLCGNETLTGQQGLVEGSVLSCGCKKTQKYHEKTGVVCSYHRLPKQLRKSGINLAWKCYPCHLWYAARSRAKELNLPFTIKRSDVWISEVCPVLGIPLIPWAGLHSPNCPTLDRIVPESGYVEGNISVISFRANRLKNDATIEEIKLILAYLQNKRAKHAQV